MTKKLKEIEQVIMQKDLSIDKINEINADLILLKSHCLRLKSLNNAALYLFTIDVYLLLCAIKNKDLDYIKSNYNAIKKNGDCLVKSESKDKLLRIVREIVSQYRAELTVRKAKETEGAESTYNPNFFVENSESRTMVAALPECKFT